MSNRVNSGAISCSGGTILILFGHMIIVRAVQHGNLLINSLSIKFSKFPPQPESTPESTIGHACGGKVLSALEIFLSRLVANCNLIDPARSQLLPTPMLSNCVSFLI